MEGAVTSSAEYDPAGYIKTFTFNLVSRGAFVLGAKRVQIGDGTSDRMIGKTVIQPEVVIRGDLQSVKIGKYCWIGDGTVLRPSWRLLGPGDGGFKWFPLRIGSHVRIGKDCVIESAVIGSCVQIGEGCVLGRQTVLKDCCFIVPGTVLPEEMVVPPFAIVEGVPGRIVGELPETAAEEFKRDAIDEYKAIIKNWPE